MQSVGDVESGDKPESGKTLETPTKPRSLFQPHAVRKMAFFAVSMVLIAILYCIYPNGVPDFRQDQEHDPFTYVILGKSIINENTYNTKHWMPGFPVMLGVMIRWFGQDWLRLKLAMVACSLATLVIVRQIYARIASPRHATLLTLALALTPLYFDYSHRLMSEIPFLAASSLSLLAICELRRSTKQWSLVALSAALTVSTVVAVMIRGNALAIVPALVVEISWRRGRASASLHWGAIIALAALILIYSLWTLRCSKFEYDGIDNVSYLQEVCAEDIGQLWKAGGYRDGVSRIGPSGLAKRVYQNVAWYQSYRMAGLIVPSADQLGSITRRGAGLGLAGLCLVPIALGAWELGKRSPALFTYLASTMLITIVYPTGGSARMLMPAIPLLIGCGYLGLERILGSTMVGGWIFCLIAANLITSITSADMQSKHPYSYDDFERFVELVAVDIPAHSKPHDVVHSSYPLVVQALTGLESIDSAEIASDGRPATLRIDGPRIIAGIRSPETHPGGIPDSDVILASRGPFRLIRLGAVDAQGRK
jgi:hypothetical protein